MDKRVFLMPIHLWPRPKPALISFLCKRSLPTPFLHIKGKLSDIMSLTFGPVLGQLTRNQAGSELERRMSFGATSRSEIRRAQKWTNMDLQEWS